MMQGEVSWEGGWKQNIDFQAVLNAKCESLCPNTARQKHSSHSMGHARHVILPLTQIVYLGQLSSNSSDGASINHYSDSFPSV